MVGAKQNSLAVLSRERPGLGTVSVARLLGHGDDVRIQNPTLQKTTGRNPRWYIRPYVPVLTSEGTVPRQQRFFLGACSETTKKQATIEKNRILEKINRHQWMISAQIPFSEFIDTWLKTYVRAKGNLSTATQIKYESHVDYRIRPAFGSLMVGDITTQRVDEWLADLAKHGLSYNSRKDLRSTLSGIFTRARKWGLWKEPNPAMDASPGKARFSREKRRLTVEQLRGLLAAVPLPLAMICKLALLTMRISEVLALQEKHLALDEGLIHVRQRYYLGDIDICKTGKSARDIPVGLLVPEMKALCTGDQERYLFEGWTYNKGAAILREKAKALGFYWKGFGFHQFRREAKTGVKLDPFQMMRMGGWSGADVALLYTLSDHDAQARAVEEFQKRTLVQ